MFDTQRIMDSGSSSLRLVSEAEPLAWLLDIREQRVLQGYGFQELFDYGEEVASVPEAFFSRHLVHPEDVRKVREMYEKLYSGEPEVSSSARWRDPYTDEWTTWQTLYRTVKDSRGGWSRAIGICINGEELNRQTMLYHQAVLRLKSCPDSMLMAMEIDLSTDSVVRFSGTPETEKKLGRMKNYDRMYESFCLQLRNAKEMDKLHAFRRQTMLMYYVQGNRQMSLDFLHTFPDGRRSWLRIEVRMYVEPETSHVAAFFFVDDVHEQKVAQLIIDAMVEKEFDFMAYVDGPNHSFWSRSGRDDFGEQLLQKGVYEEWAQEYEKRVIEQDRRRYSRSMKLSNLYEQLAKGPMYEFDYSVTSQDGQQRHKKMSFLYVDIAERQLMVICTDITEIWRRSRRQEAEIKEALGRAEKAEQSLGRLMTELSPACLERIAGYLRCLAGIENYGRSPQLIKDREKITRLQNLVEQSEEKE